MLSKNLLYILAYRYFNTIPFKRCFYNSRSKDDTIFALASHIAPHKGSPLGVIRISGPKSRHIINQITGFNLSSQDSTSPSNVVPKSKRAIEPRYATLANIRNPETREIIDSGIVLWFPSPHSYTGEDVCEFHLHGSRAIISAVLNVLSNFQNSRPADPGEFTRRAVSNEKISLLQAESLPDLIASQTEYQRRLALKGLDGTTRSKYESWISSFIQILAYLEASIDFGEDELIGESVVVNKCLAQIQDAAKEIGRFIEIGARSRELSQNGARVAILGKPNAGKSTLMNLLCKRDKSIVSDLCGTTRDVVEHFFEFGGHSVTLYDTAGLKSMDSPSSSSFKSETESLLERHHKIELEGIKRALEAARKSDVIIYLVDGGELSHNDLDQVMLELEDVFRVLDEDKNTSNLHLVINKIDLNDKLTHHNFRELINAEVRKQFSTRGYNITTSFISCTTQENFSDIENNLDSLLKSLIYSEAPDIGSNKPSYEHRADVEYVNERHLALLKSAHRHLDMARKLNLSTVDEMAQHLREAVDYLSRIVGTVSNEQVFDVIFRDFCIGK